MKHCPNCRSPEITLDIGGQSGKYKCNRCGYLGPIVIDNDDK